MKGYALGFGLALFLTFALNFSARAAQTLDLEESYRDGDYTVCIYSNGRSSAVVYKKGAGSCPSKHVKRG